MLCLFVMRIKSGRSINVCTNKSAINTSHLVICAQCIAVVKQSICDHFFFFFHFGVNSGSVYMYFTVYCTDVLLLTLIQK